MRHMHYILPDRSSSRLLSNSFVKDKYDFDNI